MNPRLTALDQAGRRGVQGGLDGLGQGPGRFRGELDRYPGRRAGAGVEEVDVEGVLRLGVDRVVEVNARVGHPELSGRALAAAADRDLLGQVRAHAQILSRCGRSEVTAEEVPDPLPGVHGRLGPVAGPVYLQEGVPGPVVGVELV